MQHLIPLQLSRSLLAAAGVSTSLHNPERIPARNRLPIVSNHRSLFDAPLLMRAINRPVRFVYHYYMSPVPLLHQAMMLMGAFPLETGQGTESSFFLKSARLLQANQVVGVFPEGADPMVKGNAPHQLNTFHRGFAHVALRAPVDDVALNPVRQPVLILASGADRLLPSYPEAWRLARCLPRATTLLLPDSGHACLSESQVD